MRTVVYFGPWKQERHWALGICERQSKNVEIEGFDIRLEFSIKCSHLVDVGTRVSISQLHVHSI